MVKASRKPPSPQKRVMGEIINARDDRLEIMETFLQAFAQTGIKMMACRAAGVDRTTVDYWVEHDLHGFKERYQRADADANDRIRAEIHRRAVIGDTHEKPIYYKGELLGKETITEKSDLLLIFLAKSRMAEFRNLDKFIDVDARTQILQLGGGTSTSGKIDPYTFATHPDFCGLDLSDKPMERLILQEFLRPGSGFNELVVVCGMRSGKGTVGSVIAWYEMYELLEIADPQRYYGLAAGQTISTVNMALSEQQAKLNVFKHIKDRILYGGKWFQNLKAFLDRNDPHWLGDMEIRLPKNLLMRCGHSRSTSQVGGTNKAVLFDEICKYKNTEGADNAEQVYSQMKATTATFGENALIVSISSPEWDGDYGMRLLKMAIEHDDMPLEDRCQVCRPRAEQPGYEPSPTKSHARMYGLTLPSWEANTALSYEKLWDSQNGAANPRAFWRDFGAKPSTTQEGYYPDPERWDRQVDKSLRYPYDATGQLAEWWKPCCDGRRFVHFDLAVKRDAAGVAMAHKPVPGCPYYETVDGKLNPNAKDVVVDICIQVKPPGRHEGAMGEIDFEGVRQFVRDWQDRGFPIRNGRVTYDGFNSVDSQQILRKEGFRTGLFSVDRDLKGHDTLQELINRDKIAYPAHPVLIREGKQLQLKNGKKVDHPNTGSKDVIDAVAAAVYHAKMYGGRRRFIGGSEE